MRWAAFLIVAVAFGQTVEFNRDVRPILSDQCFSCHNTQRQLDKVKPASIVERITTANPAKRMPPAYAGKDRLSDKAIATIERWVEEGAVWQKHWSFIPPRRKAGATLDSVVNRQGLASAAEADRRTLLRRVSFDLTGLPPSPEDVEAFVRDGDYERRVDAMLNSPRYAERMAIRWLEAARYADTNGYQSDGPRDMWRWRDWVIDAFDKNMPFDQFTIEQLAGDLLPGATRAQRIATGFQRNHRTSAEGGIDDEEFRTEYVADRTETTSTVWLGLTMGCARCHDHKYDPMKQRDFYSLFAFYNNVPEKGFVYDFGNEPPFVKAPLPEQERRLAELDQRVVALQRKVFELDREPGAVTAGDWTVTEGLKFRDEKSRRFSGEAVEAGDKETAHFNYRDAFTFAAWIRPETDRGAIMSRAEDFFEGSGHGLYIVDGKLRLHVIFRWTDLGLRVESAEPLKVGERQHVLVTYDGSMQGAGVHMFVNGRQVPTKILFDQGIWPIDVKQPFRIGGGAGLRFKGEIADVRVYDRALSGGEAATVPISGPVNPRPQNAAERTRLKLAWLEKSAPEALRAARAELAQARRERQKFYDTIPTVMVMEERDRPRQAHILKRGAYDAPGDPVEAAVPAFLPPMKPEWPRNRLGLARWIVSRENPLTARVIVNRYWQMLFGTGLVKTVEDFGSQGEWPAQQELLDWLACEFMDSGWDMKHMMKTIVMSATYRQSSKAAPELIARDPENRLLARGPRVRLAPEMLRDQALAVSGLLVEKVGGPSVKPYQPAGLWQELSSFGKGYVEDKGEGLYRRTLYSYWKRTVAPPSMVTFDSPNREVCTVRETRTNTPLQALDLMNNVTYLEASRKLAERMLDAGKSDGERIERGFRLVLGRPAKEREVELLRGVAAKFARGFRADAEAAAMLLEVGASPSGSADKPEMAAWTSVASIILNLDEAVTKE